MTDNSRGHMFCTQCGKQAAARDPFCAGCGSALIFAAPTPNARPLNSHPTLPQERTPTQTESARALRGGVLVFGGSVILVWSVLIIVLRKSLVTSLPAAALCAAYALALIRRDVRAVWLGWLIVGLGLLAVLASGIVPLVLLSWAILTAFHYYATGHLRRTSSKKSTFSLSKRLVLRSFTGLVSVAVIALTGVAALRMYVERQEAPNAIALVAIYDRDTGAKWTFAKAFQQEPQCERLLLTPDIGSAPAVERLGLRIYIVPRYYLDVDHRTNETEEWRWSLTHMPEIREQTGSSPTLGETVQAICRAVRTFQ